MKRGKGKEIEEIGRKGRKRREGKGRETE